MAEPEPRSEENDRLAGRLRDGDESVLEDILRLYGPAVAKTLCRRYVEGYGCMKAEDIEDAVSVALDKLWKKRATYDSSNRPLRAWFYCLAENVVRDVLKAGWHKARAMERLPGQEWLEENPKCAAPDPPSPAEGRKESKMLRDLKTVVEKLPEVQRKILLADAACRDEVASSDVLADELQIPAANVRVYRRRGLEKVRAEMCRLGHDIP